MLRKFLAMLLVVTLAATSFIALETTHRPTTAFAQSDQVLLRVVHAIPGGELVDLYVDGNLVAPSLAFATATPHMAFAAGDHTIAIREAGADATTPAIFEMLAGPSSITEARFSQFTVVLQSDTEGAIQAAVYNDDLNFSTLGFGRVQVINAVADLGPVNIIDRNSGAEIALNVAFGVRSGSVNPQSITWNFLVVPSGKTVDEAVVEIGEVNMITSTLYTFVVVGTAAELQVLTLPVSVFADPNQDTVKVAVAHGSADAPALDVYANDTLIIPNLQPGTITPHIVLPVGDISLAVREAGTAVNSAPAFTSTENLSSSQGALTVAALGSLADGSFNFSLISNSVSGLSSTQARITVLNTNPNGVVSAELNDGTPLANALSSFDVSDAFDVNAGLYSVTGTTDSTEGPVSFEVPEQAFVGGTYYTILVYLTTDATATVGASAFNVNGTSLPGAVAGSVAETRNTPIPTIEITPGATQAATEVATEVAAQPSATPLPLPATPIPTVEVTSAPLPPASTPVPTSNNITGVVNLNQGANLQCREYPTSAAFSLGLIPNGTSLIIRGYAGPVDLEAEGGSPTTPLEEDAFETPKEELEEFSEMWVSAQWVKPEGSLNCWTRADFVIMTYKNRSILSPTDFFAYELVEVIPKIIKMIPGNFPGGATDEDLIAPPTPQRNDPIATVNVNAGVNLHIRQLPDANAKSLALIGNGTSVFVLSRAESEVSTDVGQPEVPDWLFVEYTDPAGQIITGWISAQYVIVSQFGRAFDIKEIPIPTETPVGEIIPAGGSVSGSEATSAPVVTFAPPPAGTVSSTQIIGTVINLDAGANLNLRDRPSADGLVVRPIPANAQILVLGRNGDGTWLNVQYDVSGEGAAIGWVTSQYISVTQGGQSIALKSLPITNGDTDTMVE